MVGGNTIHNTMGGTRYNTIHAPLYPCAVVGKTNFPSHYEECVAFIGQMLSQERMHVNMLTLAIEYRIFAAQGVIQLSKKAKSSVTCWEISPRKKSLGRRIIPLTDYSRNNRSYCFMVGSSCLFVTLGMVTPGSNLVGSVFPSWRP